jgi:hypothetical protein
VTTFIAAENLQPGGATEKIGTPAPGFDVQSLGGTDLRLADLKGKVVVLNFCSLPAPHAVLKSPG